MSVEIEGQTDLLMLSSILKIMKSRKDLHYHPLVAYAITLKWLVDMCACDD